MGNVCQRSHISTSPATPDTPLDKCLSLLLHGSAPRRLTSVSGLRFDCPLTYMPAKGCVASGGRETKKKKPVQHKHLVQKTRKRVPVTVHVLLRRHRCGHCGAAENKHPLTFRRLPQSAAFNPSSCPSAAPHLQTHTATSYIIRTACPAEPRVPR